MPEIQRPVVRLRPKSTSNPIRHGFPWAYDSDIVLDRRTKSISAGSIAVLEDAERHPIASVAFNAASKLTVRFLDPDPNATIDANWLEQRLKTALTLRQTIFDTPYYRWVHAEGDGLPGLIIDRFGSCVVVQPNSAWIEDRLEDVVAIIQKLCPEVENIYKNASGRSRVSEGLVEDSAFLAGSLEAPIEVPMNGATYLADISGGQKTGLFYDQRSNHAMFSRLVHGATVLDVFSHVGGFGLAALAGGAKSAMAIDGSQAALDLATKGACAMGKGDAFSTLKGDAFKVMEGMVEEGRSFDAVVCDPPAFAPSRKALSQGLRAYERVARLSSQLVTPGGILVLCSCSHAADLSKFLSASARGIGRSGRRAQLIHTGFAGPDHPLHPMLGDTGYLKALFFRLLP